jgi:hypothetical protein
VSGIVLFSHMVRLHPRYTEAFTPAVAAMFGIGLAWASAPLGKLRPVVLVGTLLVSVYYTERLLYGRPEVWWIAVLGALAAIAFAAAARLPGLSAWARGVLAPAGVIAMSLLATLAIPVSADVSAINNAVSDAGYVGGLPLGELNALSTYLRAHQDGAYYELASESATSIGALIVRDDRPVLVLTTYNARVFTSVARLKQLIAAGKVRYAFLNTYCSREHSSLNPACSAPARWIRAHGTDISKAAGMPRDKTLYLLAGATP